MKGKILKIRPGYNPNSSSMAGLAYLVVAGGVGIGSFISSFVAALVLYKKAKKKIRESNYEKRRAVPQG